MKGFWGFMKGSLILQLKAMPRIFASPVIGAVRGALLTTGEAMDKCDADIAAFQAQYIKERDDELARGSNSRATAAH